MKTINEVVTKVIKDILAQYNDQQYALQIREAKKYAKRKHVSSGTIIPHEF